MSHSFSIIVPENREICEVYQEAYLKIHEVNGFLDGDTRSGSFSARGVEGDYAIYDHRIDVVLHRKPFLTTYNFIEKKVREYFT